MKFKKTKLTALAMSVLMAASTITSVTWAADLFTDGAPAEVAVEGSVDAFSDDVEVEDADEATLLSVSGQVKGLDDIKFHYNADKSKVLVDYKITFVDSGDESIVQTNREAIATQVTKEECGKAKMAIYSVDLSNILGKDLTGILSYVSTKSNTYIDENKGVYDLSTTPSNSQITGYIPIPYEPIKKHQYEKKVIVTFREPTCNQDGEAFYFEGCKICNRVVKTKPDNNEDHYTYYNTPVTKDNWNETDPLKADFAAGDNLVQSMPIVASEEKHVYEDDGIKILTEKLFDDNAAKFLPLTKEDVKKYFPVNVQVDATGTKAEVIKEGLEAYYYEVNFCKVCDAAKINYVRQYVDFGPHRDAGVFYVAGDNIYGFVVFEGGELKIKKDGDEIASEVSVEECKAVVLKECDKIGTYYMIQRNTDGEVVSKEPKTQEAAHAWGNVQIETKEQNKDTKTQVDLLARKNDDPTGPFLVETDANGDVIEAYSNNCTKEATYALCRVCLNPNCHISETYGEVKVAPKSTTRHLFPAWPNPGDSAKIDPAETTYTMVDATHHIEHYNYSRKCTRCGVKEIKNAGLDRETEHGEVPVGSDPDDIYNITTRVIQNKKIKDTEVEATCGTDGSYMTALICPCGYQVEGSEAKTTVPATDKHDFGDNPAEVRWKGEIWVDKDGSANPNPRKLTAYVARKCTVCGKYDSNGINGIKASKGEVTDEDSRAAAVVNLKQGTMVPAKKDPATNVTYSCSVGHTSVYVDWTGTVDGKVVKLNTSTTADALKENVPFYADWLEYAGKTGHTPGSVKIEKRVEPTADKDGSYDEVVYCTVCGDEVSRNTVTIPKDIQVTIPTVTATAVNYNTVNVSWTPVDGATSYRLYYRSADLGITTWHRVRTLKGTSFTHSGLTTGARYRYTVRAEVNGKLGDYSRTGSVVRPLPAAPEMKSVTAVSNGTKVTWSKVDGADGYIIFRKTTGAFTRVGSVSKGSKVTWTDKKPVSGATYKVRAYRTVNNVNYKGAFSAAK